jgi:hypothetical protein
MRGAMTKRPWLLLLFIAAGCADAELSATEQPISGGTPFAEPGVVGMWIGGGFCTASLIADDALVTAAHCQSGSADPQLIRVVEREASGRYRCLTTDVDVLGAPGVDMETVAFDPRCQARPARFRRGPDSSADNDFMVMRLLDSRWFGKNRDEHVRLLLTNSLAATVGLHADTTDDSYLAIGAGGSSPGNVHLRSGVFTLDAEDDNTAVTLATAGRRACSLDGGGPIGFHNVWDLAGAGNRYTVAGVLARLDSLPCAEEGDDQTWTKTAPFTYLVTQLLGRECSTIGSPNSDGGFVTSLNCDNSIACVGTTPDGATAWQQVPGTTNRLSLDVDTSRCGYATVPLYFPTLLGTTNHWRALGVSSVFQPTATGFRMVITDRTGPITPTIANTRHWRVGWHATRAAATGTNGCVGISNTAWQDNPGPGGGVFLDINTIDCGFAASGAVPTYVTSINGTGNHHRTTGVSSIYSASPTGFRVYLHPQDGIALNRDIARAGHWRVHWLAQANGAAGEYCSGRTPILGWQSVPGGGLTRHIDLTECGLTVAPRIAASIGGTTMHWNTTGATSIYDVTPTGFNVFIWDESGEVTPGDALDRSWRIDWLVRR